MSYHSLALPYFPDDGFVTTAAEPWFKVKVQRIQQYLDAFTANMAPLVKEVIVVDLFAGSGLYSIGQQREKVASTALASLGRELPIAKWIFCERDPESVNVLKIRVKRYFRDRNVFIFDDPIERLPEKLAFYVPQSGAGYRVAVFCVVDSFSIEVPFTFIDRLQQMGFSFIIPFTFCINEQHNYRFYLENQREKLKKFMGGFQDVESLDKAQSNLEFYKRLVQLYQNNMLVIGLNSSLDVQRIDSGLMELPIYYMGLFSRHPIVKSVQREVQESSHQQTSLFKN
ncbi:MAG: three-Cys-motif partner protein TcmP [Cyclobacteriaceae bacterium]